MDARQNVLRMLRRQGPESVPFEFNLCQAQQEAMEQATGGVPYPEFFQFQVRTVAAARPRPGDFSAYYRGRPELAAYADEWGIAYEPGRVEHFTHLQSPLAGDCDLADLERYPLPALDDPALWADFPAEVAALHGRGLAVAAGMQQTIFEMAWGIRGMDDMLCDMLTEPAKAECLFERITVLREAMARRYAAAGVDVLELGDDVGTQRGMMFDPGLWRSLLRDRLARVVAAAKAVKPDILLFYHSDGQVYDIIPDLIDLGIDILNPVQPECMDVDYLKKEYGQHLSFWGCLGTQSVMPFGTVEEVRASVTHMIDVVGEGGGLVLAPTHVVEPEVPLANLLAMVETAQTYGRQRYAP